VVPAFVALLCAAFRSLGVSQHGGAHLPLPGQVRKPDTFPDIDPMVAVQVAQEI
jgi:hypothetical protein